MLEIFSVGGCEATFFGLLKENMVENRSCISNLVHFADAKSETWAKKMKFGIEAAFNHGRKR